VSALILYRHKLLAGHNWPLIGSPPFVAATDQVGWLNFCRSSPVQSFLTSVSSRSMKNICVFCWACTCLEMWPRLGWGRSCDVGATPVNTVGSAGVLPRYHGVKTTMHGVPFISAQHSQHADKAYRHFLSVQARAGAWSRLCSVRWTVAGLAAIMFKLLILTISGRSLLPRNVFLSSFLLRGWVNPRTKMRLADVI
jgi:hypothetical protein